MKRGFVYIMASGRNGTIYIGSTADLMQRAWQHRYGLVDGFTREQDASCWFGLKRTMIWIGLGFASCK